MKYKLVIFDMDGTILDTLEDLENCLNYALELSGMAKRSRSEVQRFVGNGIRKLVERGVPQDTPGQIVDKVFADFKVYYKEHCTDHTKPYDGITQMLSELRKRGYKTAVVSNKADFAVQDLVRRFFDGSFDMAVGDREGFNKKPAPDSIYEILDHLGIDREDAVYVGDSEVDVATAHNASLDSIIVEWGFRDRDFLQEQGAKVFAAEPEDILGLV